MARLLEHHALSLLREAEIPVPKFEVVSSPGGGKEAATRLGGPVIVKALIPVGRRGKAGAIKAAQTPEEAELAVRELLGRSILNFPVRELLVSEAIPIAREFFASLTFDSMFRTPRLLFSPSGGVDVESVLAEEPSQLIEQAIDFEAGLTRSQAETIAASTGLKGKPRKKLADALSALYHLFRRYDAETVEINPLVLTNDERAMAASAVVVIDDQALFRHPELADIADPELTNGWRPLTALEKEMRKIDRIDTGSAIRFNEFDSGDIAFMMTGGGAGFLALDTILRLGGRPATTFDITPGRVEEKMYLATKAILSKPGLKGMIAGGNITNFIPIDIKVRGVMRALKELKIDPTNFPVVFRFAGPGEEVARDLAAELPGIEFYDAATSIEDAVKKIVELTKTR